jgi:tetratricopeptide (TPR) repeat protein
MNSLSDSPTPLDPDSMAPAPNTRRWRRLLLVLALLGLLAGSYYVFRRWAVTLPAIPQINTAAADAEVAAAIDKARGDVASSPRSGVAWGEYAMLLHANGFDEAADECYAAAQLLEPGEPNWPYLQGYLHHNGPGGPDRALSCFQRAAELSPPDSMAHVRLADILLAQGELDRAEQRYQELAASGSGEAYAQFGLARIAAARNRLQESLQHLSAIVDDPLVRKRAATLRASIYERLGNQALAEQERQRLAALPEDHMRPDDPMEQVISRQIGVRAMIAKAQVLQQAKQVRQMVTVLRETVERYPKSDVAWASLATALTVTGDIDGAERAFDRSIELAPKTVKYRMMLGKLLTGRQRFDEALDQLRTAVRLNPRDGLAHLALGECLLEKGDDSAAAEAFEATLRYIPHQAAARKYLDQLEADQGRE